MKTVPEPETLDLVRAGIDTYQEPVVYMRADCTVCRAEGFEAQTRIAVHVGDRSIIATLNVVSSPWLPPHQAGLSEAAWRHLEPKPGEKAWFRHADAADSTAHIRAKVYGQRLERVHYAEIMRDAVHGRLSDLELVAFLTACAAGSMDTVETVALTRAMVGVGSTLDWGTGIILDKHCVGGLPGNRTTPILVAIVAAAGYRIPKTSSRAITSPSGTADTMATLAPVELTLAQMREVVDREGGCIAWGGSVGLSPADDILIRVERPLDFDGDAQLVASVLSKKIAAGASHVILDMPMGPTAKIRTQEAAQKLGDRLTAVAEALGLRVHLHPSDGTQPVGNGIGPALEARDVLAVLARAPDAPADLRERALDLAGHLLELGGEPVGQGRNKATALLDSGAAERKFLAICAAQGGQRTPPVAEYQAPVLSPARGVIAQIDNRLISRIAKLAGAPRAQAAGIELHAHVGRTVERGQPLMTVHAESPGELAYALAYHARHAHAFSLHHV